MLFALKRLGIRALPGPLVVVVLGTVLVGLGGLEARGVAVVGPVPGGLPRPALPPLDPATILSLVPAALAIAFVGFMESIAVARSIAARENYAVDANRELVGLGLAGIVSGLVRGYPIGGGFGRSAVNYQSGARTQLASVVRAALLIATLLLLTPLFTHLPRAVLGAIVFVAVLGLIDLREPLLLFRVRPADGMTLVLTALVTLFVGIEAGILSGWRSRSWCSSSAAPIRTSPRWGGSHPRACTATSSASTAPAATAGWSSRARTRRCTSPTWRSCRAGWSAPCGAAARRRRARAGGGARLLRRQRRRRRGHPHPGAPDGGVGRAGVALHLAGVKGPVRDLLERAGSRSATPIACST